MDEIKNLAALIQQRNTIAKSISEIIGRPAQIGHIGEYITSKIFDIKLIESASNKAFDGHFNSGELSNKTVNVKFYSAQEYLLDITPQSLPDHYLVLVGAKNKGGSISEKLRLWSVESVFLFNAKTLVSGLLERGLKVGIATSVRKQIWTDNQMFPNNQHPRLVLSEKQIELMKLFRLPK